MKKSKYILYDIEQGGGPNGEVGEFHSIKHALRRMEMSWPYEKGKHKAVRMDDGNYALDHCGIFQLRRIQKHQGGK